MSTVKKISSAIILLLFTSDLLCQYPGIRLFVGGGRSFNGSGDAAGYAFINQVDIRWGSRFYLSPGIQLTNHFQTQYIASYQLRNVTTGISVYTNLNCLLLNSRKHQIAIGAGPVGRLQSTSVPTDISYGVSAPANNPMLSIQYSEPVHTLALGYNVSPSYNFRVSPRLTLSAKLCLQNDTRADLITSEMILLGISL